MCKDSGRTCSSSSVLRSVYELHGRAWTGLIGKPLQNFESAQILLGDHLVGVSGKVLRQLEREGKTTDGIALLGSEYRSIMFKHLIAELTDKLETFKINL